LQPENASIRLSGGGGALQLTTFSTVNEFIVIMIIIIVKTKVNHAKSLKLQALRTWNEKSPVLRAQLTSCLPLPHGLLCLVTVSSFQSG
jgi:hypothetical protein